MDVLDIPLAIGPRDLNVAESAVADYYMQAVNLDRAAAELKTTVERLEICALGGRDNRIASYYLRLAGPGLPRDRWAFAIPRFISYCDLDNHTVELSYGDG